jgi:hypothetical protein
MAFFQPLRDIANNFINLKPELLVFNTIDKNPELQKRILDLVRINQLFLRGIDGDGTDLNTLTQSGFGYSAFTKAVKRRKGQPTGHVTLFDTGDFYKSFRFILSRQGFFIDADAQKDTSNLFDDFGTAIVELTDESIDRVVEMLIPLMQKELKQSL